MELSDRTVVITGATAGIGAAVAELLHEAGARLVVTGRRADRIAEMEQRWPGTAGIAGEIADPALPQRLIALALERTGRCDVVINNAGVIAGGPIDDVDIDAVCEMVRVNVEAAYRMAYTALKHFKAVGAGHLMNTTSILGTKVREGAGPYCGTKFALEALSEALRMELARTPIRVSCIEPGLVYTELHRDYAVHPTKVQNVDAPLVPMDVARCVLFMLQQPDHVAIPRMLVMPRDQQL